MGQTVVSHNGFFSSEQIESMKRQVARKQVAQVREYSDYICGGIALVVALQASKNYGPLAVAAIGIVVGTVAKLASPKVLDALEDLCMRGVEVEQHAFVVYTQ